MAEAEAVAAPGEGAAEAAEGEVPLEDQGPPPPPPLPEWPINWSCVGIRIETLLPVDPETLVNTMNEVARPGFSMVIVDVNVLVTEELAIDPPSKLGEELIAAQANPPEGGGWLTPELVNVVLEARALKDRDDEHRREEQRRTQHAETCKLNIEKAQHEVTEAKHQLEEALKRLREFETRMKDIEAKQKELESRASFIAAAAAAAAAAMGGGTGSKKGSAKGSAKGSVKGSVKEPVKASVKEPVKASVKGSVKGSKMGSASAQVLSPAQERKQLDDTITKMTALVQSCEKKVWLLHYLLNMAEKVKVAQYLDKKQEAEKSNPLTTTRIYWCLGLGETAEALCQQATVKHMFRAIFNLAKKPLPPSSSPPEEALEGAPPPPPPAPVEPPEPVPVPPFIEALRALAKGTKLDHPARKIPVMDVLYEDPPPPEPEPLAEGAEPTEPPPPPPELPPGDLPYAMVAKAVVSGIVCLQQQMEAFSKLDENITGNYEIPEAILIKDVNVTYYKALLNAVPTEWVSLPVLLHCMVEQVAYYDCSLEDMEALEVTKCNQRLAKGFDTSVQRLGHDLSCMRRSSDLLNEIIEEIKAKQAEEDMQTAQDMLQGFLKIAGEGAKQRLEEEDRQRAEERKQSVAPEEKRKSSRKSSGLKESAMDGKKSLKDGKKSVKEGRKSSASSADGRKLSAAGKEGEKKPSRQGSSVVPRPSQRARSSTVSWDPAVAETPELLDPAAAEISELLHESATRKDEEHSLVVHELSRVGRLERTVQQKALEFLESVDVVEVEKRMLSFLSYPGKKRACMPTIPSLSDEKRGACLEALGWLVGGKKEPTKKSYNNYKDTDINYGRVRVVDTLWNPDGPETKTVPLNLAATQRYKKLKMLLELLLKEERRAFNLPDDSETKGVVDAEVTPEEEPDDGLTEEERKELDKGNDFLADCGCPVSEKKDESVQLDLSTKPREMFLPFQSITDRRFIEAFPDGLLGEVYWRAKTRLPYRVFRYDRDEDCMVEALYADERDHLWQGVAASQIGFGDYVALMDKPSPAMLVTGKHATYDVPEDDAKVLERFRCHITEDEGLVWAGLPAKTDIQWEPQTTVIKDGHMILLRAYGPDDNSESPRVKSVYACLRDGLVVCFFIAEDGTMSMQVTNPENQTIEITSMGIVRMFASSLHAKAEESAETEAPAEGAETAAPLPPPPPPPPPEGAVEGGEGAEGGEEPEEPADKRTIRDFLSIETGELESWRCVLPTGTVIRYKNNGDAQVLYRQGNVSDFRKEYEGGPCWITANNEGFFVVQRDPPGEGEAPTDGEVPAKGAEGEPRASLRGAEKKSSIAGGPPPEVLPEAPPEVEPVDPTRPILTQLPNLKVVHSHDPDSGDTIMTREDLVVVITSEPNKSTFVQHADGTQMYSKVTETYPSPDHAMSQGEVMLGEVAEIYSRNPRNRPLTPPPEREGGEDGEQRASVAGQDIARASLLGAGKKPSIAGGEPRASLLGAGKKPSIAGGEPRASLLGAEKKPSILDAARTSIRASLLPILPDITTTWHVHKEGLAKVQGKIGSETQQSGICVEFETVDGHYAATWSNPASQGKEACPLCHQGAVLPSSQISLSIPGGATLYAVGNTVSFDTSDGTKKNDPFQSEEDDRKHGPFVNTNGAYVYDVVEGSLTFTNNFGSGFKVFGRGSEWETILCGKTATQAAEEREIFKELLFQHAAAVPDGLEQDLYARAIAKYFPNDPPGHNAPPSDPSAPPPPEPAGEKKGSIKKGSKLGSVIAAEEKGSVKKGSKLGSVMATEGEGPPAEAGPPYVPVDIYAGFELSPVGDLKQPTRPGSRPATATPPPSEPSELEMLGPYPRLFVIHEAGHGYEFLTEEMYQLDEVVKFYNKLCSKNVEKYIISEEEAVFHTFVTTDNKKQMGLQSQLSEEKAKSNFYLSFRFPASRRVSQMQAKLRSSKVQAQTKCDWLQLHFELPKLPRAIAPVSLDVDSNQGEVSLVYRQIVELPVISLALQKKMDQIFQELLAWQWVNLELQEIEIIPDTRTDEDILMERYIACRIRESKEDKKRETSREYVL